MASPTRKSSSLQSPVSPSSRASLEKASVERASVDDILNNEAHAEALEVIFEHNGWTRDDFIHRRSEMQLLELFLTDFAPSIPQLQFFGSLTVVRIMQAHLTEIKYLDNLRQLDTLYLTENEITDITGLDNCTKLRELHLSVNKITKIQGLTRLTNLEILAISRNEIEQIEGLETLKKLKTLWLGGNNIRSLIGCLKENIALENLNLGGNRIGSFRDIPGLNDLPNLRTLQLSDPVYGENPVCTLCNYQTFTLFHIHAITTLDHAAVSQEQRSVAEATFIKKKIYYNMRIRTLKRNLQMLLQRTENYAELRNTEVYNGLDILRKEHQALLKAEQEGKLYEVAETRDMMSAIEAKVKNLGNIIGQRHRELVMIENRKRRAQDWMVRASNNVISRLLVELHTGGNVRLEEGRTREVWYQSCAELVRTRFFASDYENAGIKDLHVTKVTRVHNRTLRNAFDSVLDTLVDLSDPSYKRALEYLFIADDVSDDDKLNRILEFGYHPADEKTKGVPVSNSVYLADQSRLAKAAREGDLPPTGSALSISDKVGDTLVGRLVVAKVFLGKCAAEKVKHVGASPTDPNAISDVLASAEPVISRDDYAPTTVSVFRTKAKDPKQRVWFCFEEALVLPEYVIDFVYTPQNNLVPPAPVQEWGANRAEEISTSLRKAFPSATATDHADMRLMAQQFLSFQVWCERGAGGASAKQITAAVDAEPAMEVPQLITADAAENPSGDLLDAYLAQLKLGTPSEAAAKLTYVNWTGQGIASFGSIFSEPTHFGAVTHLCLSHNNLSRIEAVLEQTMPLLEVLDISHNHVRRLNGLRFKHLKKLDAEANMIFAYADVEALQLTTSELRVLNLLQNPVTSKPRFLELLSFEYPQLDELNGYSCETLRQQFGERPLTMSLPLLHAIADLPSPLQEYGIESVQAKSGKLTPLPSAFRDQLWAGVYPHILNEPQFAFDSSLCTKTANSLEINPTAEAILGSLTSLSLVAVRMKEVLHAEKFAALRHLQLCSSNLMSMDGLSHLTQLETLDLRNNRIDKMEGLSSLTSLRKVDLGENNIETIEGIETLTKLSLLALDHNQITSLLPVAQLPSLMELYMCDNQLTNEKELMSLREMPKLIIMDLAYNPCTSNELYRLYAVFQIKKLKVLDGMSIDVQELQLARDTFAGRISAELLNERLPPGTEWSAASDLSLASCALKELTLLDTFTNLRHLKLEHNNLGQLNGIQNCTALVTLNLSFNRLGTFAVGSALEGMSTLESLSLEYNGVNSIAALQLRLPRLKFLNLKSNDIMKLDGLNAVPQLREILLDKNKIRSIDKDSFLGTPLLREFYAEENSIKTVEGLKLLTNLNKASLASNRLGDLGDLSRGMEELPLTEVCFLGNPVVRKTLYRNHVILMLPQLNVLDNRAVTNEERERIETMNQQELIPPNVFTDVRSPVSGGGPIAVAVPQPPGKGAVRTVTIDGMGDGVFATNGIIGGGSQGGFSNAPLGGVGGQRQPVGARGSAPIQLGHKVSGIRTNSAELRGVKPKPGAGIPKKR